MKGSSNTNKEMKKDGRRRLRLPVMRLVGLLLVVGGIALIGGSVLLNMEQDRIRQEAVEAFRTQRVRSVEQTDARVVVTDNDDTGESAVQALDNAEASQDGSEVREILWILRIPKIDSENPVVEGTTKGALQAALGHQEGTAYPGDSGNCVIAGHRNYTFGRYFNRLDEVEIGDMIYVDYPDETLSYRVSDIRVVEPDDLSVLEQGDREILTLYTCTPIYLATHRLVITAERI
ncbi:MAG: class D sortase [Lachnospiraceae bacterium]|nr:class D sortase [Lachnospiraceae bacterium]